MTSPHRVVAPAAGLLGVLGACGALSGCALVHISKNQLPVVPGAAAAASLPASDQVAFVRDDGVLRSYCAAPRRAGPPRAVSAAVDELIAIYRQAPAGQTAPGPLFAGQTARQVLGDFGGLLNGGCSPALGARIGAALAGGSSLPASDQAAFVRADAVVRSYCATRRRPLPPAVGKAVDELIAIYRRAPAGQTAPGPLFAGQTARQVLGDFGGLLNGGCAPALGSRIGQALATHG